MATQTITETTAVETARDTSNFFHRTDYNEQYWTDYLAARPDYSQSFYQSIYTYHQTPHNNPFHLAHDIGTGPGQVAAELSKHFTHVIASDNNTTHLSVAHHRLRPLTTPTAPTSTPPIQLSHNTAESLPAHFPAATTDLVTAAECFPLLDPTASLTSFHHLLKPHGTLAIWFYGRPIFAEPQYASTCTPLYDAIVNAAYAKVIKGGGPQHVAGWTRATETMTNFFDNVPFSSDQWTDVQRIKWNSGHEMCFYGPEACDFTVERRSEVGGDEKVVEIEDLGFWERRWDVAGVRRFVDALMPCFGEERFRVEGIDEMYEALGRAMGGERAVRRFTWPVVLILARKK